MRHFISFRFDRILLLIVMLAGLAGALPRPAAAQDDYPTSPWDIIAQTNAMRSAYGLSELIVDPILMSTAQYTAEVMASNLSCSHLGGASDRVAAAGYGGGATVFTTENIVCSYGELGDLYATVWSDPDHMIPMTAEWAAYYKHIGAGAARGSNNEVYYVLHVAYSSGGSYSPGTVAPTPEGGYQVPAVTAAPTGDQRVFEVVTATPGADGSIIHEVMPGQTAWSIAIAYG
ncbi:MAG: CAP domain-containing protein, partial [Anaerolineae bacterium]|nr:CAP domain-containing protein [Anaerolineae bacterium]